jgi:hypothetical protein
MLYQHPVIQATLFDVLPSHDGRSLCKVTMTVILRHAVKLRYLLVVRAKVFISLMSIRAEKSP